MASFDFFSSIFCINLPESKDRWKRCKTEFSKVGILDRVQQIHATPPDTEIRTPALKYPRGEIGVSLSQTKALVHALENNASNVLIFEDDVVFENNIENKLAAAIAELPPNWDIFFLGGNPCKPMTKYSSNLNRPDVFVCAFAYAVNRRAILRLYNNVIDNITLRPYDIFTSDLATHGNGYCINTPLCWQDAGTSVIRDGHRDYKPYLLEQWHKNSPKDK